MTAMQICHLIFFGKLISMKHVHILPWLLSNLSLHCCHHPQNHQSQVGDQPSSIKIQLHTIRAYIQDNFRAHLVQPNMVLTKI